MNAIECGINSKNLVTVYKKRRIEMPIIKIQQRFIIILSVIISIISSIILLLIGALFNIEFNAIRSIMILITNFLTSYLILYLNNKDKK